MITTRADGCGVAWVTPKISLQPGSLGKTQTVQSSEWGRPLMMTTRFWILSKIRFKRRHQLLKHQKTLSGLSITPSIALQLVFTQRRFETVNVWPSEGADINISERTRQTFSSKAPLSQKVGRVLRMNETWFFLLLLGFACAVVAMSADTAMDLLVKSSFLRFYCRTNS